MARHFTRAEINAINEALLFDMPPVKTDVGIVFGGALGNEKLAEITLKLYERKAINHIIISGGNYSHANNPLLHKFEILQDLLLKNKLPANKIAVEKTATNTEENIRFSLPLGLASARSITAICRTPHQRRVLMTMRKYLPHTPITTATYLPGSENGVRIEDWPNTQYLRWFVLTEFRKVVEPTTNGLPDYVSKGYCVPIDIKKERNRLARLPLFTSVPV